ncbi:DUF3307 domain-containing protein [Bacillus thuringiensis]|uniref:DUF3307 domain-containing protein n=1 Tax=Bacillus thuringiensis TaxID=1428 RepID=UPI003F5C37B8
MNLALFSAVFIIQFVGHRIGDYLLQTDVQAQNKATNAWARFKHCFVYSFTIAALVGLILQSFELYIIVFLITIIEHMIIDTRKPVLWFKRILETKIARNKNYSPDKLPFFVLIEIDQTIHYTRILVISLLIGYGII